jgi:predicted permease
MSLLSRFESWKRSLFREGSLEQDLDQELRAHVELLVEERIREGMAPTEARRAALLEAGGIEQVKEACRDVRSFNGLDTLVRDVRYAARVLLKARAFTAAVVLTLALGIGATTAVFLLINAVLLKSLPVDQPEELVWLRDPSFSYPIFEEVRARGKQVFSGLFAWDISAVNVAWEDEVQQAPVLFASGDFYTTLGVSAVLGRTLTAEDDREGGGVHGPAAVISYDCWQRRFNRDPAVVGKTVRVERLPFTIVGVTPPGFYGVAPGLSPEITLPLTIFPGLDPGFGNLRAPAMAWLHIMGRLRPGLSRQEANSAFQVFWPQVMEAVTDPNLPGPARERFLTRRSELMPGAAGFSRIRNQFREPLLVVLGFVGLLLLVACASAANLLLVRASARQREIAVRFALGASRGRLLRQLLTEGALLALLGAAGGWLFAQWGAGVLVQLMNTGRLPVALELSTDWRLLLFTISLTAVTTVLFSLAPAVRATRPSLLKTSRTIAAGAGGGALGRSLVVSQIAIATLLLSGAALFARSLTHLVRLDPGFEPRGLLIVSVDPLRAGYREGRLTQFYAQVQERLGALAGVGSVSLSWAPPISNERGGWTGNITADNQPVQTDPSSRVFFNVVSPGYFGTVRQRLLRGRDFGPQDHPASVHTCIVSDSLARAFFPGQDPLGHRISVGNDASRQNLQIVGVVQDAKYQRLQEPDRRVAYLPYQQAGDFIRAFNLVAEVRTAVPPGSVIQAARRELRALEPALQVRFETVTDRIRESLVTERTVAVISGFLGVVALLLACVSLYGLLAYAVSRRTSEMGVRLALGAPKSAIGWMVVKSSLALAVCGLALGVLGSLALGRLVASLVYGVTVNDPLAIGAAGGLMAVVSLAASLIPARRAAGVDPMMALRHE